MKGRQKITRVLLNSDLKSDFSLFGIVTAEPDYRLSLSLNKILGISLKNDRPVDLPQGISFSRFSYHSSSGDLSWHLISNKSGENVLLNKLRKMDYLLQICPNEETVDFSGINLSLRKVETITAVFQFEPDEIKDKNLHYLIP